MAPDKLIEVSFEVSNKVGGIYQVLKSKASKMDEYYDGNYLTVGIYNEENARKDFAPREGNPYEEAFEELEEMGVECHYGVWNIPSSPKCVLLDVSGMEKSADDIKEDLWEKFQVDSMTAGGDFDEPIQWSYAVGELLKRIADDETVVHLHEWLSGPAMLEYDGPSVFTTHATVLGRALSNSDFDLKKAVNEGEIDQSLAEEFGVKPKHQVEKMAAENASVFTTVSKTTGQEATAVLGVEPDIILPNGFNVEDFPSLEELSYQHTKKKEKVRSFLSAYFRPYYDVDLDVDPRILFISGRYEYHNKGVDIFIEALSEVNQREGDDLFVFVMIPSDVKGQRMDVLENMSLYQELEDYVDEVMPKMRSELLRAITSGEDTEKSVDNLLDGESRSMESLRKNFHTKKGQKPPLCAFDLNYDYDEIMESLQEHGLTNDEDDRVKVVFYPTYLSVGDRLLSMDYNDFIVAASAGIFPSYYEPWGYTPVETAANGALAVTTDLAGFGQYLYENTDESERTGIRVLERDGVPDDEASANLAEMIDDIATYSKTEITERKHNARKLAQLTSWEKLGENYRKAHEKAMEG